MAAMKHLFDQPPEYLCEDWPGNTYFLDPQGAQLNIPAKEIVNSLDRVKKRYRRGAKSKKKQEKLSDRSEELAASEEQFQKLVDKQMRDKKIHERRMESLEMKAFGSTIKDSRMKAREKVMLRSCQAIAQNSPRLQTTSANRKGAEFIKVLNHREATEKNVFELLTESQQMKHGEMKHHQNYRHYHHHRRHHHHQLHLHQYNFQEVDVDSISSTSSSSSSSSSDSEASAELYTEAAVIRRISTLPIAASLRHSILLSKRRNVIMSSLQEEQLQMTRRLHIILTAFSYLTKLRIEHKKRKCVMYWESTIRLLKVLIHLQANIRKFLARKVYVKKRTSVNVICAFCKLGLFKIMHRRKTEAAELIAQFLRDHRREKQLAKVVRGFLRKVRICQRICRRMLQCRQARVLMLHRYANIRLGLNFDRYHLLKQSMNSIFTGKLINLISQRRKDFIRRRDMASDMLARGEGVFHTVRLEEVRQFLQPIFGSKIVIDLPTTPPQVTPFANGISDITWNLFSYRNLENQIRKYHHHAIASAKSIAEHSHLHGHSHQSTHTPRLGQLGPQSSFRHDLLLGMDKKSSKLVIDQESVPSSTSSGRTHRKPSLNASGLPGLLLPSDIQAVDDCSRTNRSIPSFTPMAPLNRQTSSLKQQRRPSFTPMTTVTVTAANPTEFISSKSSAANFANKDTNLSKVAKEDTTATTTPHRPIERPMSSHLSSSVRNKTSRLVNKQPVRRPVSAAAREAFDVPIEYFDVVKDIDNFIQSERAEKQAFDQYYRNEIFMNKGKPKKLT